MSKIEPQIGNVADAFLYNTNERITAEELNNIDVSVAFGILQDELFKSLRVLENAIVSK